MSFSAKVLRQLVAWLSRGAHAASLLRSVGALIRFQGRIGRRFSQGLARTRVQATNCISFRRPKLCVCRRQGWQAICISNKGATQHRWSVVLTSHSFFRIKYDERIGNSNISAATQWLWSCWSSHRALDTPCMTSQMLPLQSSIAQCRRGVDVRACANDRRAKRAGELHSLRLA